jgi:ankyrin repeat protein
MSDINIQLLNAISTKNTSLCKEILLSRPSVERQNEKGFNALQMAIKNNMTEIIEGILSLYKGKIVLTDNLKLDVLHLAIKQSNLEIIKMLVSKIGIDKITRPLYLTEAKRFLATDKGREVYEYIHSILVVNLSIDSLIELGVELDVILNRIEKERIKIGYDILTTAITYKDVDYFIPLYNIAKKQGLDVNRFCTDSSWTMLFDAIYENKIDIVKFLCEDPDIDVNKGSDDETPFYLACQNCRDDILMLLINRGADLNKTPIWSKPALFHLVENGIENDAIRDMFQHGLNPNEIYRDENVLNFYIKDVYNPYNDNNDIINLLIEYADINHTDSVGNTPLINAVKKDFDNAVEIFIRAGADPTIKNIHNKTAYDYASPEIIELLPKLEINDNVLYEEDPRVFTKEFNMKVFDIVNFDDIELIDFVKHKENIVYFIRDDSNGSLSSYGISRKNFRKCIKNDDNRCTFPTGHTVNADEFFKFMIEDFTLYQLTKKNVKCFTCHKFEEDFKLLKTDF